MSGEKLLSPQAQANKYFLEEREKARETLVMLRNIYMQIRAGIPLHKYSAYEQEAAFKGLYYFAYKNYRLRYLTFAEWSAIADLAQLDNYLFLHLMVDIHDEVYLEEKRLQTATSQFYVNE